MFGGKDGYFYNETIRKAIAVFGTLFNEIYVGRTDASGNLSNEQRVPLAYGPKQKFLERIQERPDLESEKVAIKLPRMSFYDEAPVFDPENQRSSLQKTTFPSSSPGENVAAVVYRPAAYRIPFELSIYARNNNEALQIVEQIIPYFKPSLGLKMKPIEGFGDVVDSAKIILQSVGKEDTYEGGFTERRAIIYTLSFDFILNIYGKVNNDSAVIKTVAIDFLEQDTNDLFETMTVAVNPSTADADDVYTIDITYEYGNE